MRVQNFILQRWQSGLEWTLDWTTDKINENLPINWNRKSLTKTNSNESFTQFHFFQFNRLWFYHWLHWSDWFCKKIHQRVKWKKKWRENPNEEKREQRAPNFYLNDGTGNDWPKQRIDKDFPFITWSSCKRSPEIFGATDPTGSKFEKFRRLQLKSMFPFRANFSNDKPQKINGRTKSNLFYLNEGTGNDCPRQRIDNAFPCFISISCNRPPEIFGATDPTGSKLNKN